jgi:hypothetical protein
MRRVKLLNRWVNGSHHMLFAVPMVWREPKDHSSDCYFCLTNITGITSKSKYIVKYPNVPSAMRPVPHNEALPIPKPPANVIVDDEDSATDEADLEQVGETFDCDPTSEASCSSQNLIH